MLGFFTIALAIATLCFSPPDNSLIFLAFKSLIPKLVNNSSILAVLSLIKSKASSTFSYTFNSSIKSNS